MARIKLDSNSVRCRTYGHSWHEVDSQKAPQFGYPIWLRCERCNTTRIDILDRSGDLLSRRYEYTDEYRQTKLEEPLTKAQFRQLLIQIRTKEVRDARKERLQLIKGDSA